MPYPVESVQLLPHVFTDTYTNAVQSASVSAADKMKIEPGKILFMKNTTSSKMMEQNDHFSKRKVQSFLCFLNVPN